MNTHHNDAVKAAIDLLKQDLGKAYKDYSRYIANIAALENNDEKRKDYLLETKKIRRFITKIQWILNNVDYVFDKLKPDEEVGEVGEN